MRIAIDVRATQTLHRERGVGRYVFDLVQALAGLDGAHEFGLLFHESKGVPEGFAQLPARFRMVPVEGPEINGRAGSWVRRVPRLRSLPLGQGLDEAIVRRRHLRGLERAVEEFQPDVLHLTAPIDVYGESGGRFGCRTVATFFDAIPLLDRAAHYDGWPSLLQRQYDRQLALYRQMDAVVAISRSSRDEAIRLAGCDPERTFAVHLTAPPASDAPADIGRFSLGAPYFLFVSSFDPHKNAVGVVRAFAKAQTRLAVPHRLVMVSSKTSHRVAEVEAAMRECGVEGAATITGFVPDAEISALIRGAVALVTPSFYEGFGLPALQAMAEGTPPIASDRTSQPEVVGDAGLLVAPDDVGSISDAMVRLADDADLRGELGRRGRARAALFSPGRLARNTLDVYEGRPPSQPIPEL